jgi:uncharacterized protein (TIGR02588 family)
MARRPDRPARRAEPRAVDPEPSPPGGNHIPAAEWVFAGVGLVLVLGTVGALVVEAAEDPSPPAIELAGEAVVAAEGGHLLIVRVRNAGEETAAELVVEGTLSDGAGTVETAEVTFDYLAPRSERRGGLFFARDPARFAVELRPKSYRRP